METLLKKVYASKKVSSSLKIISHVSVLISVTAYTAMLIYGFMEEPIVAVKLAASAAVPYIAVSVLRRLVNAPRPYELYGFYEIKPKEKVGQSFPSRHVFSAFVIATLAYTVSAWLGAALSVVAVCLAAIRVLLGMHFIRDVVAGGLIGIASGMLGIIIII
jgi:membrane-associated phospholipid phosphatase